MGCHRGRNVALTCGCSCCAIATAWNVSPSVKRIQCQDFDVDRYYAGGGPKPLLIANALETYEDCCETFVSAACRLPVDLQNQLEGHTEIYSNIALGEALDAMYDSNPNNAYMMFCEGILDAHADNNDDSNRDALIIVQQETTHAKDKLFPKDPDWFSTSFPSEIQPPDAVVISGSGATSTLHRDPFEWLGTSLCLEGSKVWRFVEPKAGVADIDVALNAYRLESNAWECSGPVSAGWQSDLSLYGNRETKRIPSGKDWFEMKDTKQKRIQQLKLGSALDILKPDLSVKPDLVISTALQQPGDLLLIPAHFWHQTFALEPSVSVASQRCGRNESISVFQHILQLSKISTKTAQMILKGNHPEKAVSELLSLLQINN